MPRTVHDREGRSYRDVDGKAVALIEFLPGVSVDHPTPDQARAVGVALAQMHIAARDFGRSRTNALDLSTNVRKLQDCGAAALATIDPALPAYTALGEALLRQWPADLPQSVIHSDLFPDNVLMLGNRVTGMIDFYFACTDAMAYDLAVTHTAWSFERGGGTFRPEIGTALMEGYQSLRPLQAEERGALPLLAQGACLRFITSRAEDWIDTPVDAQVTRKDPMDFARRCDFYVEHGDRAFA